MITTLTSSTYFSYIRGNPRYTVVTIKSADCKPCIKGYELFEKLVKRYEAESNKTFHFAVYELIKADAKFIKETLGITGVPTFDIYNAGGERVFRTSSPKNFGILEDYMESIETVQAIDNNSTPLP